MKYFTKEVKIGLVGLVAIFILIYGINFLKGINMFKPTSYYYVNYANINGLAKSSPVFADGFKIGSVREIYYDYTNPGNVTVEVEMDTKTRIPKGSSAELEVELLGTVKMNLILSRNTHEFHQVGDTIPGTLKNGIMEAVTDVLVPQVEKMMPRIDSILISLNTILADPNIPGTLESVKHTADNLAATSKQLNSLLRNDIPQLTGKLNTIGDNFIEVSNSLKEIDYASTFNKIDDTMANVKLITEKLNSKDNTFGLLLNDSSLYNNLNATGNNAAILLEDLKAHPKRYVHFSLFGRKEK